MALTQDERIAISKKIVEIPIQDAQADKVIAQLEEAKIIAQKEDDANKTLMDEDTPLINAYQSELERYDGDGHTQLVEQDIEDSANKTLQNPFFPNDPQTPLPNVPDGVWKNFAAFSGNKAIGRNYDESFTPVTNELSLIGDINAQIVIIEGFSDVTRSTGQECIPGAPDVIQNHPGMQAAAAAANTAVQAWEDLMNGTFPIIPTNPEDPDPTRSAQNDAARQDITDTLVPINTWQALPDFDTGHGQTTCAGFNSINVSTLNPTKFRAAELQGLKDAITSRLSFLVTRVGELDINLGSVTQDFGTGEIIATAGFHGTRFRFIDMRLNLIGGSLSKLKGLENGQAAQEKIKQSNANAAAAYDSVMKATQFRAPGAGNNNIHVLDAGDFSVSDSVFVTAEKQQEIATTIAAIDGNRVVLNAIIPEKYRETALARLYKVL